MSDPPTSCLNAWPSKSLLPLLCGFAFLSVCFPVINTDIWWHLAAGRAILQQGRFLFVDPFSAVSLGQPWTDVHWLFQVTAFGVHSAGGVLALVVFKCLLFSLAAFLLLKTAEVSATSRLRSLGVAWLCLLMVAGRSYVLARPIVFTLVFLGAFLYALERFRRDGRRFPLLLLPLVQLLWSNSQALSILGPLIFLCYLAGEGLSHLAARAKLPGFEAERNLPASALARLLRVFALVAIACLATPYGLDGVLLPFKLLGRIDPAFSKLFSLNVSENIPPWILERAGSHPVEFFHPIAAATFASFLLSWRRINLSHLLLAGAMLALALLANRNVLLFYTVAGPIALVNVCSAAREHWKVRRPRFFGPALQSPLLALAAAGALGLQLGGAAKNEVPISQVSPFRIPEASAEILARLPQGGNLFCSVRYGGYLIWALHPKWLPIIDGRLAIRAARQFSDYLRVVDQPDRFDGYHQNYDFQAAVLPASAPDRYRDLIHTLYRHPDWKLVYTDGTQTLFLPSRTEFTPALDLSSRPAVEEILADLAGRYRSNERVHQQAVLHLGSLLILLGHYERAEEILADLAIPGAQALLARCHLRRGRIEAARDLSLDLLRRQDHDPQSLNLLALIALEQGDPAGALDLVQRVLDRNPYNREALQILEGIRGRSGP